MGRDRRCKSRASDGSSEDRKGLGRWVDSGAKDRMGRRESMDEFRMFEEW